MADVYEQNLPQKTNLTTNDYVRVVGSDDVSYKQPLSDVAQKTIENYAGSTLAGSTQSVKGAIDGLKSSATADKAELNASINEVASDLASESSTRASQDTNLQAQINQLVAPTGTAPNPAEIENARIGADNVTYTTLGDAIRTQVSDLKSDNSNNRNLISSLSIADEVDLDLHFIQGGPYEDNPYRTYGSYNRVVLAEILCVEDLDSIEFICNDGWQVDLWFLTENKPSSRIRYTNWVSNKTYLLPQKYIVITGRRSDNEAITPATFKANVTIKAKRHILEQDIDKIAFFNQTHLYDKNDLSYSGVLLDNNTFDNNTNGFATPLFRAVSGDKIDFSIFTETTRKAFAVFDKTGTLTYSVNGIGTTGTPLKASYTFQSDDYWFMFVSYVTETALNGFKATYTSNRNIYDYRQQIADANQSRADIITQSDFLGMFRIGGFNGSTGAWQVWANGVVTREGFSFKLNSGDKIVLTDTSGVDWRLRYVASGSSTVQMTNWIAQNSYEIITDGEYWIELETNPSVAVENLDTYVSRIRIARKESLYDADAENNVINQRKDWIVKSINHRGMNLLAPENTIPAFALSAKLGWKYVETDIASTSDGVIVLLHDAAINRTARNADGTEISETINIADITYEQALTYDFGIWKGPQYAGTRIPTLDEFLSFCKRSSTCPYLDFGSCRDEAIIKAVVDKVKLNGMKANTTYVATTTYTLEVIKDIDAGARLGLICSPSEEAIAEIVSLKNGFNEVFADCQVGSYDATDIKNLAEADIPLEVYTPNYVSDILAIDPYVTGITSDYLVGGKVLFDNAINE